MSTSDHPSVVVEREGKSKRQLRVFSHGAVITTGADCRSASMAIRPCYVACVCVCGRARARDEDSLPAGVA